MFLHRILNINMYKHTYKLLSQYSMHVKLIYRTSNRICSSRDISHDPEITNNVMKLICVQEK